MSIWPFQNYPWTNLHNLNLDWMLGEVKSIPDKVEEAVKAKLDSAQAAVINVRSIGVTPENNPDDNALRLNNRNLVPLGATLYFPAGLYQIGSDVRLYNATSVIGDGDGVSTVKFTSVASGFAVRPADAYSSVNISVSGVTIDGGAYSAITGEGEGGSVNMSCCTIKGNVDISGADRVVCFGVHHTDSGHFAVTLSGTMCAVTVNACSIRGLTINGSRVSMSIVGSSLVNNADDEPALLANNVRAGDVVGCQFSVHSTSTTAESVHVTGQSNNGNIKIDSCYFSAANVQTRSIYLSGLNSFVSNLRISGASGLYVQAATRPMFVLTESSLNSKYSGDAVHFISYT